MKIEESRHNHRQQSFKMALKVNKEISAETQKYVREYFQQPQFAADIHSLNIKSEFLKTLLKPLYFAARKAADFQEKKAARFLAKIEKAKNNKLYDFHYSYGSSDIIEKATGAKIVPKFKIKDSWTPEKMVVSQIEQGLDIADKLERTALKKQGKRKQVLSEIIRKITEAAEG